VGMNLVRDGEGVHLSTFGWLFALGLATKYGWRPMGARQQLCECDPPAEGPFRCSRCDKWERTDYASNDWQCVEGQDAAALASALERALNDSSALEDALEATEAAGDDSGWRQRLTELVALANRGEFLIT